MVINSVLGNLGPISTLMGRYETPIKPKTEDDHRKHMQNDAEGQDDYATITAKNTEYHPCIGSPRLFSRVYYSPSTTPKRVSRTDTSWVLTKTSSHRCAYQGIFLRPYVIELMIYVSGAATTSLREPYIFPMGRQCIDYG